MLIADRGWRLEASFIDSALDVVLGFWGEG